MINGNSKLTSTIFFLFLIIGLQNCTNPSTQDSKTVLNGVKSNLIDSLDFDFEAHFEKEILPSFAVSIFSKDEIFYQKEFGYADVENKKLMNENTIQNVASVSKILVAVCLMKAVEENKISLDDKINDILPYKIQHPNFPNNSITIRHLATHTSSISDDKNYNKSYIFSRPLQKKLFQEAWAKYIDIYNKNQSMPMENFLETIFSPKGKWNSSENFIKAQPGTQYEYSNLGAALLAHCIEISVGKDFKTYSKEVIFNPLKMNRSEWDRSKVDTINHVVYYNENYNAVPPYFTITYPDGGLFTSINDLTIFLQEMMKGYYGESKMLSKLSFQEMMKNQIPDLDTPTGIIWDLENDCCIGHGGNDFGVSTMMYFNPKTGIGKILFSNISIEKEKQENQFYSIFNNMFKYDSEFEKQIKKSLTH